MAGNFTPKMLAGRARVSAALQAATIKPFEARALPKQDGQPAKSSKPPKSKSSSIAIALRRAF